MILRKLATVRKISNIRPIENADAIELCSVDGWDVVVKKGIHKEGDLAVYIEVDSLLDENNPVFEFMRPRRFQIKTIKIRNVVSQGIVFPLDILSSVGNLIYDDNNNIIGVEIL